MHVFHNLTQPVSESPTVLTIGAFDGVHLGHQHLIRSVVESARVQGYPSALVTFFPHPSVILGRAEPFYLTSNEEKLERLNRVILLQPPSLCKLQLKGIPAKAPSRWNGRMGVR